MNFYFNIKSKPHICKYTEGDMPSKLKHFKDLHLLESEILFWTSEHVQLFCSFSVLVNFKFLTVKSKHENMVNSSNSTSEFEINVSQHL